MGGGQGDQVGGTPNDQSLRERGAGHHLMGVLCASVELDRSWEFQLQGEEVLSWGCRGMEGPRPSRVSTELSKRHIHFHPALLLGPHVSTTFISG